MASQETNNSIKPIDSLIEYIKDIKPYHTKFLEIIERYNFVECMDVGLSEILKVNVHIANTALCQPTGYGIEWDEKCGFDPLSCCDLFECIGGYGLIFDNSDILVSTPVLSIDSTIGTITVSGDYRSDIKLQIESIPTANSLTIKGDYSTLLTTHSLFAVQPLKIYEILETTIDSFVINGLHLSDFSNNPEFVVTFDDINSGQYSVIAISEDANNTTIMVSQELTPSVTALGQIESAYNCTNQGTYQVTGASFDGIYTTIDISNTNEFDFTNANEQDFGAIQFRTALTSPRIITLIGNDVENDRDFKVINTVHDSNADTTTITINGTLVGSSTTGTVNLIGYNSGHGFDGFEDCSIPQPYNIHNNFSEYVLIEVNDII